MKLRVFTDGACSGNPGPGGWGAVYAFPKGIKKVSGGKVNTTNNEMELLAVVRSLEHYIAQLVLCEVDEIEINSDSAYVVNAINQKWIEQWKASGWKTTNKGNDVKNYKLWKRLLNAFDILDWLGIKVNFIKVRGHSGNELNEMVDKIAKEEVSKIKGDL